LGSDRLSVRSRLALVAVLGLGTLLLALAPRPLGSPLRKVANYRPDPAGPLYNQPVDDAAFVRAGKIVPPGSVYVLLDGTPPSPGHPKALLHHDLLGAAYLHLLPSVPSVSLRNAGWVIVYHQPIPNAPIVARYRLAPGVTLLKLGRA
jgi:hypothetical protein